MSQDESGRYRAGQTALLATVAEAEPLVEHWRQRFDASAAAGIPAHVTVLFPFLDIDLISAAVIGDLTTLLAGHGPFTVRFDECGRFLDVLYLAPAPDQPFRALTESIAARWPEAPPYGGQFAEVIPHLTVAHGCQGQAKPGFRRKRGAQHERLVLHLLQVDVPLGAGSNRFEWVAVARRAAESAHTGSRPTGV